MGFNRRKMEDERQQAAEKAAAARRATDDQVLEDAERLIVAWNERQAKRMPMLFSPTIGAAITARYWFLWVRCPACRTTQALDLRMLDRHRDAAVTSLIPALSCRSCRPNAPFAELVRLSRTSIADEMREEHTRRVFGDCLTGRLRTGPPGLATWLGFIVGSPVVPRVATFGGRLLGHPDDWLEKREETQEGARRHPTSYRPHLHALLTSPFSLLPSPLALSWR